MKKKLAILISLMTVMCFAFAACGGGSESSADLSDSKYVGTWEAGNLTVGDVNNDLGGGVYNLTLNGDGTGSFYSKSPEGEEETDNITWVLTDDGFKTKGDTALTFTDDGDGIKTNILGVDLHFTRAGEVGPDDGAPDIGTQYGYMGQDPQECAVWKYLCEDISVMYDKPEDAVTVPVVQIIKTEDNEDGSKNFYGDFWVFNYKIDGDTLVFVSGGAHPGMMTVSKDGDDYKVTEFKPVEDGSNFETSGREIFGDDYDKLIEITSDSDAREKLRAQGLADYVKTNGLSVTKYQDYDQDPVDLAL